MHAARFFALYYLLGFAIDDSLIQGQQESTVSTPITTPTAVAGGVDAEGQEKFCVIKNYIEIHALHNFAGEHMDGLHL